VLVGLAGSSDQQHVVDATGADRIGSHPQHGEFGGGLRAEPPADAGHFAWRRSAAADRQLVQRSVFPEVTSAGAGGVEVNHALERVRAG
jgi:hypothetical protein